MKKTLCYLVMLSLLGCASIKKYREREKNRLGKNIESINLAYKLGISLKEYYRLKNEKYYKSFRYDIGNNGELEKVIIESNPRLDVGIDKLNKVGIYVDYDRVNRWGYTISRDVPIKMFMWWGDIIKGYELKDGKIIIQDKIIYQRKDGTYDWKIK